MADKITTYERNGLGEHELIGFLIYKISNKNVGPFSGECLRCRSAPWTVPGAAFHLISIVLDII